MTLTEEQLNEVEEWAKLLFSAEKIAKILMVDPSEFKKQASFPGTPIYKRYHRGFALSEVEVRKRQIELAKSGSAAAAEAVDEYIRMAKSENNY